MEVVPEKITVLGKCIYNELPFEVNRSREADEAVRLKYRYLDLRNPAVKEKIVLRSKIVSEIRRQMTEHDFLDLFFTGGGKGLSGALKKPSREILCAASGASAV